MLGDPDEDSVELDLTEVYTTLTGLKATQAVIWHFCAYNLNLEAYTKETARDALSPGSTFAKLHPEGKDRMSQAHQAWLDALDNLEAGIDFLEKEVDDQRDDLIRIDPYDDITQDDLDEIKENLPKARNILNSSDTFTANWDDDSSTADMELEISLYALFNNPVEDFKTLFLPYTVSLFRDDDLVITWEANSFEEWILPNPTINGLFPGMTDRKFKETFGIDGDDWEKQITID